MMVTDIFILYTYLKLSKFQVDDYSILPVKHSAPAFGKHLGNLTRDPF